MGKFKCIKNMRLRYIITFFVCFFMPFVVLLFYGCRFLINDDFYMMLIAEGEFGNNSQYLIFINLIIGYLLKCLYYIMPYVNWYVILQLVVIVVSFWIITIIIFKSFTFRYACVIKGIMFLTFEFLYYTEIQFNKTAAIACITGFLLVYYATKEHKNKYLLYIIGMVFIFIGGMYREGVFKQTALFAVGLIAWSVIDVIYNNKSDGLKIKMKNVLHSLFEIRGYIICFICSFLVIYFFTRVNTYIYSNGEFKEYKEYRVDVTRITDYHMPDWKLAKEDYLSKGITEEEYIFVTNFLFADTEVFDVEKLQKLSDLGNDIEKSDYFFEDLRNVLKDTFSSDSLKLYYIIVVFVGLVFIMMSDKNESIKIIIQLLIFFLCIFYYCLIGRTREYIEIGMALAAFITIIVAAGQCKIYKIQKKNEIYLIILSIFILISGFKYNCVNYENMKALEVANAHFKELYEYMGENYDNFYMLSTNATTYEYVSFSLLKRDLNLYTDNRYRLGDWMVKTPFTECVLEKYQINNPIKSLIDKNNVYLVCNGNVTTQEIFQKYFIEEYDVFTEYETVKEFGELKVIKFKVIS